MYARNEFEIGVLNVLRGTTFAAPANVYVGLLTANPGDSGPISEASYTGYTRIMAEFSPPAYDSELTEYAIKLTNNAPFAEAPIAAGTVTDIGIFDSPTPGAGTCWLYGHLDDPIVIDAGEAPTIVANEIIYMATGNFSDSFKSKILNFFRGVSIAGIVPYVGLFNGQDEIVAANYARPPIVFTAPVDSETGIMYISNVSLVTFNQSSSPWGTYNAMAILDSQAGGVEYARHVRGSDRYIGKLKRVQFKQGDFKIGIN